MYVNFVDLTSIQLQCIIPHIKQFNLYNLNYIFGVHTCTNTWQMSLGIAILQTFNCM